VTVNVTPNCHITRRRTRWASSERATRLALFPTPPETTDADHLKCDAFGDGIPWPIQEGEFDHSQPHPGDHGLQHVARSPMTSLTPEGQMPGSG